MRETVRERKGKGLLLRGRDEGMEGGKGNGGPGRENVTVEQQVVTPSKRIARLGLDNSN